MPAFADTTIKLIRPPHPGRLDSNITPLTDEESAAWRKLNEGLAERV